MPGIGANVDISTELKENIRNGDRLAEAWSKAEVRVRNKSTGKIQVRKLDFMEGITDNYRRRQTACLLENYRAYLANLSEDTRLINVGTFDKWAFPIIRAVGPSLIAEDLVSVQSMQGPTSMVFHLDFRAGQTKGTVQQGQTLFSAITGRRGTIHYTSETIDSEAIGTGDGAIVTWAITLQYNPVRPGTLRIVAGGVVGIDNGNGAINGTGITGTITYPTGVVSITFTGAPSSGEVLTATYLYDSEANLEVPDLDVHLTGNAMVAQPRKLRARWSIEGMMDLRNVHGVDADSAVTEKMGDLIKAEIDAEIISDLRALAGAAAVAWNNTTPANISYAEHKLSFVDALLTADQNIFQITNGRAVGTFVVAGAGVARVIESLPRFKGVASSNRGAATGPLKIGRLNDHWDVFKDPYTPTAQFLVGYKGTNFLDAGYVYAPYILFFTTATITLDDLLSRKGMLTRYAKRMLNPYFYCLGTVTNL